MPSSGVAAFYGAIEEIIFRGILQNSLYIINSTILKKLNIRNSEKKAFLAALIPCSISFGLFHLRRPKPSLIQITYATVSGVAYGYLSHYSG